MAENNLESRLNEQEHSPKFQKVASYLIGSMTIAGIGTGIAGADSVMESLNYMNEFSSYAEGFTKILSSVATSFGGYMFARGISKTEDFKENLYNIIG